MMTVEDENSVCGFALKNHELGTERAFDKVF